jgi:hypothetical protein
MLRTPCRQGPASTFITRCRIFPVALFVAQAVAFASVSSRTVSFVVDPAPGRPAQHGIEHVGGMLRELGYTTQIAGDADRISDAFMLVAGTTQANGPAARALRQANVELPTTPESLVVRKLTLRGKSALVLCGADDRGLMYALLETAEQLRASNSAGDPFTRIREATESPFIRDRSLSVYTMNRAHWESRFHDERYWTRYFDLLAVNRFNRFLIIFGYENGGFLAPPYPFTGMCRSRLRRRWRRNIRICRRSR